jgi:hypothetical protein
LVVIVVVLWIVRDPAQASTFTDQLITFMQKVLVGLMDFFSRVANKV